MVDTVQEDTFPDIGQRPMRLEEARGHKGRIYAGDVAAPY